MKRYGTREQRGEFLRGLHQLVAQRAEIDSAIAKLVADARGRGVQWADLGGVLGMTAQGAQQRYRDVAPIERHRPRRS